MTFATFLQRAQISTALGLVAAIISQGLGAGPLEQTTIAVIATALAGAAQGVA